MADKIVAKKLLVDGSSAYVEYAKRDSQGNIIHKTYVTKDELIDDFVDYGENPTEEEYNECINPTTSSPNWIKYKDNLYRLAYTNAIQLDKPELTVDTIRYTSRTCNISVYNINSISCDIYISINGGEYIKQDATIDSKTTVQYILSCEPTSENIKVYFEDPNENRLTSEIETVEYPKAKCNTPILSYSNRQSSSLSLSVKNTDTSTNSADAVTAYVSVNGGNFTAMSSFITGGSTVTYSVTGISSSSGYIKVYFECDNHIDSEIATINYSTCVNPCSSS